MWQKMCGIAGVVAIAPHRTTADAELMRRIRDYMWARGPDASGEWISSDKKVALGHRRLSIIDTDARSNQPMCSEDGRFTIVFNGEIYNYRQLRARLESERCHFKTSSDTEVLLELFCRSGEAMLRELRGMYALAIWDSLTQELFLARDPLGIKPVYYARGNGMFQFASQVKAILAGGGVSTQAQPAAHIGFYLWGHVPEPWTMYKQIRSVPAGHFLKVKDGEIVASRPFCTIGSILREATDANVQGTRIRALEAIRASLLRSVSAHHVSDVPVGLFLSSGLDSALIASLSSEMSQRIQTITIAFEEYFGTLHDEAPLAEALANQIDSSHQTFRVKSSDFVNECDQIVASMDQPSIDGINTWFVAKSASRNGMKVALSGIGGDELFGSYPSFRDIPRLVRYGAPFLSTPRVGITARKLSFPFLRRLSLSKYSGILEYGGSVGGAYLLRRSLYAPWEIEEVLDAMSVKEGLQELEATQTLNGQVDSLCREMSIGRTKTLRHDERLFRVVISALEISNYMQYQLLRDADWAGMAHSLEIRVPLADVYLLREVFPWMMLYSDITKKEVARFAAPRLGSEILERAKTGFTVPVHDWLRKDRKSDGGTGLRGWARYIYSQYVSSTP